MMITKPFILSGGGSRGFAHIGVAKALQEYGILPDEIAGTSAGALAGVFLANGFTTDEITELVTDKSKMNILKWNGFKPGVMSMKPIRELLLKNLRYTKFEDLPIPFYVTATNFKDGKQTIFHTGDIIDPVIAACSIPVVFPPVVINNIPYVDGGLSNNMPIEPFMERRNEVICINVNPIKPFKPKENTIEVIDRAVHLSFHNMVRRSTEGCFLFIEPTGLNKYEIFDVHKAGDIVNIGYNYTKELLQDEMNKKTIY